MSTSQHTAEVVIKGRTDGVSAKLKDVADGTEKVRKASEAAGAAQEDWGSKLDKIDSKMSSFAGGISKVTGLLGAGGLAGMALGAASAIGELADRAAKISAANQGLKISIQAARESTMGMVSDFQLTISANKAVQLGVVSTGAEFAKLAQNAAKLGASVGMNATESLEKLSDALAQGSADALAEIGVLVDQEAAFLAYAVSIDKSVDSLTDLEKKQALIVAGLEAAQIAADKTNISFDNQANKIASLAAKWANLQDRMAGVVADGLEVVSDAIDHVADKSGRLQAAALALGPTLGQVKDQTYELGGTTLELLHQFDSITGATDLWRGASEGLTAALKLQAEEQAYVKEQAMLARQLIGPALPPKESSKGKSKKAAANGPVYNMGRDVDYEAGTGASEAIADAPIIAANSEAYEREIQLREDRIALAEHEQEIGQMRMDAGLMETEQVEELTRRKYDAEQELLDFQISAATTREEIADLELQKRRASTRETQRLATQAQQAEIKSLKERQNKYEGYANQVGDALGQVALAGIAAAEGQEYAGRKAVAAIATSIRDQMILQSLKEFALAIASAASFNFPGAAAHAAAGVQAGIVAGVAGVAGAAINASIPSPPDTSSPPASSGGSSSGSSSSKGGGSSGGGGDGDDDGVPTSYSSDGALYNRRPSKSSNSSKSGGNTNITINANVIGSDPEKAGLELARMIDRSKRSQGSVK